MDRDMEVPDREKYSRRLMLRRDVVTVISVTAVPDRSSHRRESRQLPRPSAVKASSSICDGADTCKSILQKTPGGLKHGVCTLCLAVAPKLHRFLVLPMQSNNVQVEEMGTWAQPPSRKQVKHTQQQRFRFRAASNSKQGQNPEKL